MTLRAVPPRRRPRSALLAAAIGLGLLASACSTDEGDSASTPVATDPVVVDPGGVSEGAVTIDGTTVDYVVVTPEGFEPGDEAPVALAFPPGGQDLDLTRRVVNGTYATEAVARGWVVISPAAPDGVLYFRGSEELVPGFMDWVSTWVTPEADRFHLIGVSNGGLSSFRAAAGQPERVASIMVFPGFPRGDDDKAALTELVDVPIRLYVGENDEGWVEAAREADARLQELGADVVLTVYPDVGHFVEPLSDGRILFDELDSARP